jgi:hypothetical protein
MAIKFQIKRNASAPSKQLDVGELGYATTNKELYVGNGIGNDETKFISADQIGDDFATKTHSHAISDVTGLSTDLAAKALATTSITGTGALGGGGTLAENRTITHGNTTRSDTGAAGTGKVVTAVASNAYGHITAVTYTDISGSYAEKTHHHASADITDASADANVLRIIKRDEFGRAKVATPVAASDIATKGYVDNVAQGLDVKQSVMATTVKNYGMSGNTDGTGTLSFDGVPVPTGSRVLLKDQANPVENGIYILTISGSTYTLARATDAATGSNMSGNFVFIERGSADGEAGYANTGWVCTSEGVYGTNASVWTQFTGNQSISIAGVNGISASIIDGDWVINHSTSDGYKHVPATGTSNNGKVLTAGATAGSLSWAAPVTSFVNLTDTPAAYTSQGGKLVAVNSGATALEFINSLDCGTSW